MTRLQKLILDALDQLGPLSEHSLATACLISPKQKGGFRSTLNKLFEARLVHAFDFDQIQITREGVGAVEADNIAHQ